MLQQEDRVLISVSDAGFKSLDEIKALPLVKHAQLNENKLDIRASNTQLILQDILFILSRNGARIKGIEVIEPDLETVFLSLTGRTLRD